MAEKKKKERMDINLPNARRSMRRSREMKQLNTNREDLWKLLSIIFAILVVAFILLGGINQWEAWKAIVRIAENIGKFFKSIFSGGTFEFDDGIYFRPS